MKSPVPRYPILFWALLLGAGGLAWGLGYAQEDAYISFRYAENLIHGHGLTFNPGEAPVEGYSNFLWVLWAALLGLITDDFPEWVRFSGVLIWLANLWLVHRMANRHLSWLMGLGGVLVLGYNAVLASSVATGLETPLAAFWVTFGLYYWLEENQGNQSNRFLPLKWSLVALLAVLTRPDLGLPFAIMGLSWLLKWTRNKELGKVSLWLPSILLSLAYLYWKWRYFGDLLPNTFYAKVGGSVSDGGRLVMLFLLSTGFGAYILAYQRPTRWFLACMTATLGFWVAFGGDYMGFRVLIPLSSLGFVLAIAAGKRMYQHPPTRLFSAILFVWMALGLLLSHFWPAWIQNSQRIQFRAEMKKDAEGPEGLMEYGKALVMAFGQDSSLRMATGAAGIVPFLTHYHTLDMMGLTNKEVAKNYQHSGTLAGHGRFADAEWVRKNGANIVVGRWIESKTRLQSMVVVDTLGPLQLTLPGYQSIPDSSFVPRILWLNLPKSQFGLAVIYLKPHPAIENALNSPTERGILAISPILAQSIQMPINEKSPAFARLSAHL